MTIRDFYGVIDANFDEVISRLGKEERIQKYLFRFADEGAIENFDKAYEAKDYSEAFRATHSIKGMCLNLGLSQLGEASSVVCEALREGPPKVDLTEAIANMREAYTFTIDAIKKIS